MGDCCSTARTVQQKGDATNYEQLAKESIKNHQYEEALSNYEKALESYQSDWGDRNMTVASVYMRMAEIYQGLNKEQEAIDNYKKYLEICAAVNGEYHPGVESMCEIISNMYILDDKKAEACEFLEKLLKIKTQTRGELHNDVASVHHQLGGIYLDLEEYDKSISHYEKCIVIKKYILGEGNEQIATLFRTIGYILLEKKKEPAAAVSYIETSLAIFKMLNGSLDSEVARCYHDLGVAKLKTGRLIEARECFKSSLELIDKVYWDDEEMKMTFKRKLYLCFYANLQKIGSAEESYEYERMALEIDYDQAVEKYGKESYVAAFYHLKRGDLLVKMKKYGDSLFHYQTALDIFEMFAGDEAEIGLSHVKMGMAYFHLERYDEAQRHFEEAKENYAELTETLDSDEMAEIYLYFGKIKAIRNDAGAKECIDLAFKIFENKYGYYHPKSISCVIEKAKLHRVKGEFESALELLKKAYIYRLSDQFSSKNEFADANIVELVIEGEKMDVTKYGKLGQKYPEICENEIAQERLKEELLGHISNFKSDDILDEITKTFQKQGKKSSDCDEFISNLKEKISNNDDVYSPLQIRS